MKKIHCTIKHLTTNKFFNNINMMLHSHLLIAMQPLTVKVIRLFVHCTSSITSTTTKFHVLLQIPYNNTTAKEQ